MAEKEKQVYSCMIVKNKIDSKDDLVKTSTPKENESFPKLTEKILTYLTFDKSDKDKDKIENNSILIAQLRYHY